jgi:hypothetical protein
MAGSTGFGPARTGSTAGLGVVGVTIAPTAFAASSVVAYAIFYNFSLTKSATVAVNTGILQQLAVLSMIFLFLRWRMEGQRGEPLSMKGWWPAQRLSHCFYWVKPAVNA